MSYVDSAKQRDDGHSASPIWVSDRPEERRTAREEPEPAFAPVERASLQVLLRQPRFRRLRNRLLLGLAVGVAVGFLAGSWQAGLTLGVAAAVADAVYRARMTSSVPAWRRVSAAERRTEAQLRRMERIGYRTLHARAIPGSDAQIDHLVIGPTGVYAVDSEKWDKKLPLRVQMGKKLFHGPFNKKDRLKEAHWEASEASKYISEVYGRQVVVVPSLAVYGPAVPWKVLNIRGVDVYEGGRARKWITKRDQALTETEIDRLFEIAAEVLPARYGDA